WCYADFILVPYEKAEAAASGRPRGNLSDLYPRLLGARELLLHGRDPYSPEITREIQLGYYGRPIDPSRANDPTDQQGFAYPVYVVFLLAPTVPLPFSLVQAAFRWFLVAAVAASVPLWLYAVRSRVSTSAVLAGIILTLGSFPAVQGIKLQQLTLLVCTLLGGSVASLVSGRLVLAAFLLALSTIKPQLAMPFVGWLGLWTLGDWRSRQRFAWTFLITLVILVLGGEFVLPGWIGRFRVAASAYLDYAGGKCLLDLALTPGFGRNPGSHPNFRPVQPVVAVTRNLDDSPVARRLARGGTIGAPLAYPHRDRHIRAVDSSSAPRYLVNFSSTNTGAKSLGSTSMDKLGHAVSGTCRSRSSRTHSIQRTAWSRAAGKCDSLNHRPSARFPPCNVKLGRLRFCTPDSAAEAL